VRRRQFFSKSVVFFRRYEFVAEIVFSALIWEQEKSAAAQKSYEFTQNKKKSGSVLLMVVFIIALLSSIVMGMLQMNTEEIQIAQNQVRAAEATATAEAGLNDALYQIRTDPLWTTGFAGKAFNGGSYTVTVAGSLPNRTITSIGTAANGFVSRVAADITVGSATPHVIRIDKLRVNE